MSEPKDEERWRVSFEENRRAQLETWLSATPAERLRWLEQAIELAHRSGALERLRQATP